MARTILDTELQQLDGQIVQLGALVDDALGKDARRVLRGTMDSFARRDVRTARHIWQEDDVVDVRYHLVRHDLMALMEGARAIPALQSDSRILQRATYLLWIAHKLERVADHSSNICERTVFIVEGAVGMQPEEE